MNNQLSQYKVEAYDSSGNLIADISGLHKGLNLKFTKNRAEEISFACDLKKIEDYARDTGEDVLGIFTVDINEIRVTRGATVLCAGQIDFTNLSADVNNQTIEVRAKGWLDLFDKRYTDESKSYSAEDPGAIAWDLIDVSQTRTNGDFGITEGAIDTSYEWTQNPTTKVWSKIALVRDREYEYKNIKEAIIQLSEVINGFDFEFTWDKQFNVFYPRQSNLTEAEAIVLEYPRNIKSINLPIDGTAIANYVVMRGQGQGTEQLVEVRQNSSSQANYKLRDRIVDMNDVKEAATLQDYGDEILRVDSAPFFIPQITLTEDFNSYPIIKKDFWLDDPITIKVQESDMWNLIKNVVYRIEEIKVTVSPDNVETVSLNVSQA